MAMVAEGERVEFMFLPNRVHELMRQLVQTASGHLNCRLPENPRALQVPYGLRQWGDFFTPRQLVALNTFSDIVEEAIARCRQDALVANYSSETTPLHEGGTGALAYSQAIGVYLAFLVDQVANHGSSLCGWNNPNTQLRSVFSRQAIAMTWDYAETNVFSDSSGSFANLFDRQIRGFEGLVGDQRVGFAFQENASDQEISFQKVISTDPPYYDNIAYADLSDFFYVWLRRSLRTVYPSLFATMAVPKTEELVATAYRHGGKKQAEEFFLSGMTSVMRGLAERSHPGFPVTIYYAFKAMERTPLPHQSFLSAANAMLTLQLYLPPRISPRTS
jgi:putative DNA methylase